jgi:hypothetical protein
MSTRTRPCSYREAIQAIEQIQERYGRELERTIIRELVEMMNLQTPPWAYTMEAYYTVKEPKKYPWPCEPDPKREIDLYPGDVLMKNPNGTINKHNGLFMMNIHVPESDLVAIEAPAYMAAG